MRLVKVTIPLVSNVNRVRNGKKHEHVIQKLRELQSYSIEFKLRKDASCVGSRHDAERRTKLYVRCKCALDSRDAESSVARKNIINLGMNM